MVRLNNFLILIIKIIIASDYINKNYDIMNNKVDQSRYTMFEETNTKLELQKLNPDIKNDSISNSYNFLIDYLENESIKFVNYKECNSIEHTNKSFEINNAFKVKSNKRKIVDDEQLDLNTKYRCLEKEQNISSTITSYLHHKDKILDNSISNFESDIKKLVCLKSFKNLYEIIENDFINILIITKIFSIFKNEYISPIISKFEDMLLDEQKIFYFINIANEILNKEISCLTYNEKIHIFINNILFTNYYENENIKMIYYKLYNKSHQLNLYIKNKNITYDDVLTLTIDYINKTEDKIIQYLLLFGFQSLFDNFSKNKIPKIHHILIILYAFHKEKNIYDVNWYDKIYKTLTQSFFKTNFSNFYDEILKKNNQDDFIETFSIYLAMNANIVKYALNNYIELKKEDLYLKIVKYLFYLTNNIKCKLFGIRL